MSVMLGKLQHQQLMSCLRSPGLDLGTACDALTACMAFALRPDLACAFAVTARAPPADPAEAFPCRRCPAGSELDFFAAATFAQLGASGEVLDALKAFGISTPSHVQAAAYKVRVQGSGLRIEELRVWWGRRRGLEV